MNDMNYSLESYTEMLEKQMDSIAIEGFNLNANSKFGQAKKKYKAAIKEAKGYVKSGEPDKVAQKMDEAKAALQESKKEITSMSGGDTASSAVIGNLLAYGKWVGTNLLVLLAGLAGSGVGVAGGVAAGAAAGLRGAQLGSVAIAGASGAVTGATIATQVNNIKTTISGIISLAKAYDQKKGAGDKMSPNDFNMFYRGIIDSIDKFIKHIDKVKAALVGKANKKKVKLASKAATEAALVGDLITATEGMIAMISYLNGEDYTPETDAGYAVESAIECACFEEEFLEAATE